MISSKTLKENYLNYLISEIFLVASTTALGTAIFSFIIAARLL